MQRHHHIRRSPLRWLWLSLSVVLAASLGLAALLIVTSDGTTTTASPRAVGAVPSEGGKAVPVGESAGDRGWIAGARKMAPPFRPAPARPAAARLRSRPRVWPITRDCLIRCRPRTCTRTTPMHSQRTSFRILPCRR